MGIIYYMVNHKTKEMFELGKAPLYRKRSFGYASWDDIFGDLRLSELHSQDLLLNKLRVGYYEPESPEPGSGYFEWLVDQLVQFSRSVSDPSDIEIMSDARDSYYKLRLKYPITRTAYANMHTIRCGEVGLHTRGIISDD